MYYNMSPLEKNIEKSEFNIKTVASIVLAVITLMAWMYGTIVIPLSELKISVAETNTNFDSRITRLETKVFPINQ